MPASNWVPKVRQGFEQWRDTDGARLVLFSGIVGLMVLAFLLAHPAGAGSFPDDYMIHARKSIFDPELYYGGRSPVIYLFFKLSGYEPETVVVAHRFYSAAAWAFLGYAAATRLRHPVLQKAVVVIIALAACCWNIAGWNNVLLTESLAFSGFAFWMGSLILWLEKPTVGRFVLLALTTLIYGFTRDVHVYSLVMVAGLLVVASIRVVPKRAYVLGYLVLTLVLFLFANHLSHLGKRHQFPFYNVMFQRILPHPDYIAWFDERGAPMALITEEAEHAWLGEWASSHQWALYRQEPYQPFRTWTLAHGKSVYTRFLLSHPGYVVSEAWSHRADIYSHNLTDYTFEAPGALFPVAGFLWQWPTRYLWLLTIPVYVMLWRRFRLDPLPPIVASMAVATAVLVFHGDAMEVPRHAVAVPVMLQWCGLYALFLIGDLWLSRNRGQGRSG